MAINNSILAEVRLQKQGNSGISCRWIWQATVGKMNANTPLKKPSIEVYVGFSYLGIRIISAFSSL
jgi:hypothetical protein